MQLLPTNYFTFCSVYMSMPLSHFVPACPSTSLCPQFHSLFSVVVFFYLVAVDSITFLFLLIYFYLSNFIFYSLLLYCSIFSFFLSFFFSMPCTLWDLGSQAKGQTQAPVVGAPSPNCWTNIEPQTPGNINQSEASWRS